MTSPIIDLPQAPPDPGALLSWDVPPLPVLPVAAIVMAGLYCWGVYRVRRTGRAWSQWRTSR